MTTTPKIDKHKKAAALALLEEIHMERVTKKATLRREFAQAMKDALNDVALRESRAANDALEAGNSKTAIGRAIGTSNWTSIEATLARTRLDATVTDFDSRTAVYAYDAATGVLTVTPTAEMLAPALPFTGWTQAVIDDRPELQSARFETISGKLVNLTPDWMEEDNDRHPVVAAITRPEQRAAALDWLKTQPDYVAASADYEMEQAA